MTILILTAMEEEQPTDLPNGFIGKVCGMGAVESAVRTSHFIQELKPKKVILLGTCGSLNKDLKQGDIVIGKEFINNCFNLKRLYPGFQKERIIKDAPKPNNHVIFNCIHSFVNQKQKHKLEGDVVDMESYAVARACIQAKVPYEVVKVVSDNFEGDADIEFKCFLKYVYNPKKLLRMIQ